MDTEMKRLPFDKKPKKKLKSLSSLKKKANDLLSEYVRRKGADPDGFNECVCCGVKKHWKKLQAAHLVPGRRLGILFDIRGIYPNCYGCNIMKKGNYREYDAYLDNKFGREYRINLVEELRQNSKKPTKWTREQYQEMIETIKTKLLGLNEISL